MNKRVQIILLTTFVISCLCTYFVYRAISDRITATQVKTTRIIVAGSDMKLGSVLRASDLGTADISGPLPKGAIVNAQEAIGRGVISDMYQGEPVLESRLAAPGAGGGLASTIRPGMRACAIKVDEVVGVAGFATPGMHVDVLISGTPQGGGVLGAPSEGPKVKTLLQNIEVLSAGQDIQRDVDGKPQQVQVVNLLVTPEQAEELSLASNETKIQLVLRNPLDTAISQPPVTAMSSLFNEKAAASAPAPRQAQIVPKPVALPRDKTFMVQVYNGSKRSDQTFVNGEEKQ